MKFLLSLKETSVRRILIRLCQMALTDWVSGHGNRTTPRRTITHCRSNSPIVFRLLPNQRRPHSRIKILRWFHHRTLERGTWQVPSSFFNRSSAPEKKKSGWAIYYYRDAHLWYETSMQLDKLNHTVSLSELLCGVHFKIKFTPSGWKIIATVIIYEI
jgi:hypothetical protein